jgi:hypothetical protein
MTTPKNMRAQVYNLNHGGTIHTYINDESILLQIRRSMPTEEDILQPSFKVAVNLSPHEALAIATELLLAVSRHLKDSTQPNGSQPSGKIQ